MGGTKRASPYRSSSIETRVTPRTPGIHERQAVHRARLAAAICCNVVVLCIDFLLEWYNPTLSGYRMYWHNCVLAASNLTGMMCASILERQRRLLFLRNHELTVERNRHRALARHDLLTGIANRSYLLERLEAELGRLRREGRHAAVMFIDLDNFKPVNDRWRHAAGDRALREVAERFRKEVRASDVLSHCGGWLSGPFTLQCARN